MRPTHAPGHTNVKKSTVREVRGRTQAQNLARLRGGQAGGEEAEAIKRFYPKSMGVKSNAVVNPQRSAQGNLSSGAVRPGVSSGPIKAGISPTLAAAAKRRLTTTSATTPMTPKGPGSPWQRFVNSKKGQGSLSEQFARDRKNFKIGDPFPVSKTKGVKHKLD